MCSCRPASRVAVGHVVLPVCLFLAAVLEPAVAQDSQDPLPSLDLLIERIEQVEESLRNLKIESTLVSEEYDEALDAWVATPRTVSATTWLEAVPQDRMRMDIHEETLRWRNGAADYGSDSFSLSYDGRKGKIAHHLTGPMGEQFQVRRGEVTNARPPMLDSPRYQGVSGAGFSLLFFSHPTYQQKRFSDYLRYLREHERLKLEMDTFRGVPCIRVLHGELDGWHEVYYLDPARGHAMLGRRFVNQRPDGSLICLHLQIITELKQVAPGIWYPLEAHGGRIDDWPDGQLTRRAHYLAQDVVANDPDFDEDVYNLTFPAKYYVTDKRSGATYLTTGDPDDWSAQLDQMVDFIRQPAPQ